jgi:hypothetical protein
MTRESRLTARRVILWHQKKGEKAFWLGGLDSNQDSQIQSLESYQLDDLPAVENSGLTSYRDLFLRGKLRKN